MLEAYACVSDKDFAKAKSAIDVFEAEKRLLFGKDRASFGGDWVAYEIEYYHRNMIVMTGGTRLERDQEGNDVAFHRAVPGYVSEYDRLNLERGYFDRTEKRFTIVRLNTERDEHDQEWNRGLVILSYACTRRMP